MLEQLSPSDRFSPSGSLGASLSIYKVSILLPSADITAPTASMLLFFFSLFLSIIFVVIGLQT